MQHYFNVLFLQEEDQEEKLQSLYDKMQQRSSYLSSTVSSLVNDIAPGVLASAQGGSPVAYIFNIINAIPSGAFESKEVAKITVRLLRHILAVISSAPAIDASTELVNLLDGLIVLVRSDGTRKLLQSLGVLGADAIKLFKSDEMGFVSI